MRSMETHGEESVVEQLVRNVSMELFGGWVKRVVWNKLFRNVAWKLNDKKEKASSRRDNLQKTYSTNSGIDNAQNLYKKRPMQQEKTNKLLFLKIDNSRKKNTKISALQCTGPKKNY